MTEKEEQILKEIITYVKENKVMPTRRYLQRKLNYKSVNSITWYIKSLEKENYLIRNKYNKLILNNSSNEYYTGLKNIKIINSKNNLQIILNKNKRYIAYKINNNYFNNIGILKEEDRTMAGKTAPACGLYLRNVFYWFDL